MIKHVSKILAVLLTTLAVVNLSCPDIAAQDKDPEKAPVTAKAGDKVTISFTGTLEDGSVFATTEDRDPFVTTIGEGRIFAKVEENIIGMKTGDSKTISLSQEEAFGPRREELVTKVDKTSLPEDLEPVVGMHIQAQTEDGQATILTVVAIDEDTITIDANHPLAGKNLNFEITLMQIN